LICNWSTRSVLLKPDTVVMIGQLAIPTISRDLFLELQRQLHLTLDRWTAAALCLAVSMVRQLILFLGGLVLSLLLH
jgi:hypothetical protein